MEKLFEAIEREHQQGKIVDIRFMATGQPDSSSIDEIVDRLVWIVENTTEIHTTPSE